MTSQDAIVIGPRGASKSGRIVCPNDVCSCRVVTRPHSLSATPPKMVHRPVALAQFGGVPDGAGDVLLNQGNRVADGASARKVRGQRRRKRAAGAVRMPSGHTFVSKFDEVVTVVQQVDDGSGSC